MSGFRETQLTALKAKIAALEAGGRSDSESLPFGDPRIDDCLPGGGLPLGQWHEIGGEGMELETAAAAASFSALMAAPLARQGEAVWIMRRDDLFAPGLQGLGFPAERLIQVCVRDEVEVLTTAEDALATVGVKAVFLEADEVDLTAGRRLQLACEKQGATGFLINRRPYGGQTRRAVGTAAATRWQVAPAPSQPGPDEFGLGPPRWRVELARCRGGRTGAWLFEAETAFTWEASDGPHPLRLVAPMGDSELAPATPLRRLA